VLIDLRNIYHPEDMKKRGFLYASVGRAPTHPPVNVHLPSDVVGALSYRCCDSALA